MNEGRKTESERRVVFISPHLDDAVFSVGGMMAALAEEGYELYLVTCFTRSVLNPTGFALACQLDKGLTSEVDYMEMRRQEDALACQRLNAKPYWLDLLEAPHRGYHSAPDLFQNILPDDSVQDELVSRLEQRIRALAPDLVLSPVGIGNHVDHQQVKQALSTLQAQFSGVSFLQWYDEPYLSRHPTSYPQEVSRQEWPGGDQLIQYADRSDATTISVNVAPYWKQKMSACAAYATQLGFQFGGEEGMRKVLAKEVNGQTQYTELIL